MTRSVTAVLCAIVVCASGAAIEGRQPPDSRTFVNEMAIASMAEVELGKLATERAASADVKAFGQMMVKDHTAANKELMQAAAQLKIQPATQLDQKHRDLAARLSKLTGAEFDRAYITAMVEGHEEVATKLGMRAATRQTSVPAPAGEAVGTSGSGEQALTTWATKTLPTVEAHLKRARELQQVVAK